MSGTKFLGNIIRSTSRIASQMHPGICRDITQSKRKLCTLAALNWNADVLNTKFVKKSVSKFSYSSPITLGCLSTIQPLLIETSDNSCCDMLECLGGDEDGDTWSYI
ncbi:Hypothetical predicted protein [Paramuricea clavata]|uniref:Uncharacterized protein n=1 Tax=Paramuricea clavata TaxID=317549 RepID=A0A7D9LTF3_PARCT|nr:Hypothetical predicted protein [Paramuricea clavata]